MKLLYYNLPNFCIAQIGKVGSSSLARAIIASFPADINPRVPDYEALITDPNTQYPIGVTADNNFWQRTVPNTSTPTKPVFMFVREPVQRFLSAMAQCNLIDIDAALAGYTGDTDLVNETGASISPASNFHFMPQLQYAQSGQQTKLYQFPGQITQFCSDVGMEILPLVNPARNPKPVPTDAQTASIQAAYAADVALYNSISAPGQVYS